VREPRLDDRSEPSDIQSSFTCASRDSTTSASATGKSSRTCRSICTKIEPSAQEMKQDDQIKDDDTGDGVDRLLSRHPPWELLKQAAAAERGVRKSISKSISRVRVARRPKALKEATTTDSFFAFVFHVQLACVAYALVASFAPKPVGLSVERQECFFA
jgi:hypothetical protein